MTEAGEVTFRGRWSDETKEGLDKTRNNIRAASGEMSKATSTMVSEQAGRAMSQFNEKTEKGRQLLTTFGGAVGGAAGNVVYYTGTLSYVIGRFNLLELGVMAGVAAIGALTWALMRDSEEVQKWNKVIKESDERVKKLRESIDEWLESEKQQREGWTDYEKKLKNINEEIDRERAIMKGIGEDLLRTTRAIDQLQNEWDEDLVHDYFKAWMHLGGLSSDRTRVLKEQVDGLNQAMDEAIEKEKEREAGRGKAGKPEEAGAEFAFATEDPIAVLERINIQQEREYEQFLATKKNALMTALDLERQYYDMSERMWEENADRKNRIEQNMLDYKMKLADEEKQKQEDLMNARMANINLYGQLAGQMVQGIQTFTDNQVAAILLEAGLQAAMEFARGWATLALRPEEAATHFIASGLFAAVGIGKAIGASKSGGGGSHGGSSVAARQASQGYGNPYQQQREKRTTIVVLQMGDKVLARVVHEGNEAYQDQTNPGRWRENWS